MPAQKTKINVFVLRLAVISYAVTLLLLLQLFIHKEIDAGQKKTVAVLNFEVGNADPSLGMQAAEILSSELVQYGLYVVIERQQIEKILKEQSFELSGAVDTQKAVQAGKLLNADYVFVGSLREADGTINVTARLVDVSTSEIVSALTLSRESQKDINSLCANLAQYFSDEKASYTASSQLNKNMYGAEKALDGDESTSWKTAAGNTSGWLEMSFFHPKAFQAGELYVATDAFGAGVPKYFTIEYFSEGGWKVAKEVRANMMARWKGSFEPKTASRWRIKVTSVISKSQPLMITEFSLK